MNHAREETLPLPPGYVLARRLGVGSFGSVVTVASQPQHHQKVAVKTIDKRRWQADDACGGLYAIKQEAQALRELSGHPNVIDFVDAVETDDYYHLITQHNTGGDLYEHLYETTYTLNEDDLTSDDEWGADDVEQRGHRRTVFLNEREADDVPSSSSSSTSCATASASDSPAVRQRERQGLRNTGSSPRAHGQGLVPPTSGSYGQHSPRGGVLELKEYGGRLSDQEAQPLFRQIVRALQYCHAHGIAHRDLKPENIFLDDNQTVLLADFGLCTHFTPEQPRFVPCCGSLLYTAPEIIKELPYVGPEIDVWGLGILLYEMLCGCTPYQSDKDETTRQRILSGAVTFPDHISSHARALISGMLQVDPALRFDLAAIKKHPWNLYAQQQPSISSLTSPRGLVSPRLSVHQAKPYSLNLASMPSASRAIPSPRYDSTTSPRRMALPRPLVNPDNADCLLPIPGGADFEPAMMTRPRSSSSSSSSSSLSPRLRPALWHSPQLSSPDPSPRGPAGLGSAGPSPRSFLSTGGALVSPRSRLSPGSPRELSAASKIYYSLMTMEEERKLRLSTKTPPKQSAGEEGDDRKKSEESESDDESDDESESEDERVDSKSENDREKSEDRDEDDDDDAQQKQGTAGIRKRLNIGRIDLSLVKESPASIPTVVVDDDRGAKGAPPKVGSAEKHVQENGQGKAAKTGSVRKQQQKHRSERGKEPIYSAQSLLESPRAVEGRSRSSSFGASRDKVAVMDFVSSMRDKQEQKH